MTRGLTFVDEAPVLVSDPNRTDIACFVGFVNQRQGFLSGELAEWLARHGWATPPLDPPVEARARDALPPTLTLTEASHRLALTLNGRPYPVTLPLTPLTPDQVSAAINTQLRGAYAYLDEAGRLVIGTDSRGPGASVLVRRHLPLGFARDVVVHGQALRRYPIPDLVNVPVPIDTWDVFDQLYAWEQRTFDAAGTEGASYLGSAVRSFFAQGGRKCYVVRAGDPPLLRPAEGQSREERIYTLLSSLIPGYPDRVQADPLDPATWQGVAHLFGLPDVSLVCLPDLPDVVSAPPVEIEIPEPPPRPDEQFVECSTPQAPPPDSALIALSAPRCDDAGYAAWARAIRLVGTLLARHQREVQLVAALPLPLPGHAVHRNPLAALVDGGRGPLAAGLNHQGIASAFVQLVYPWVQTPGSASLPEQLEPPGALLAGLLARNALTRGTYRSAARLDLGDVYGLVPALRRDQTDEAVLDHPAQSGTSHRLFERVSLLGPTPTGFRLLSDVTTSLDESYRLAGVNRLVAVLVRASRRLGESLVFEPSGETLWRQVREQTENLLRRLWEQGALRGASAADAYRVRCDRSTMTQRDLDAGRLIVEVTFAAAASIEQITVVLALEEGGQVSLVGGTHA